MSAEPKYPHELGYFGLRMSADDYLAIGETGERYELIDGVVVMSPSVQLPHNLVSREINLQLEMFARHAGTVRVFDEIDVKFSIATVYRPDICAYLAERLSPAATELQGPPDLVVEVLSPSTRPLDLVTKRADYERFGVREYWAVEPADGSVRCWKRVGDRFTEVPVTGDHLPSSSMIGFTLDLAAIRRAVLPFGSSGQ